VLGRTLAYYWRRVLLQAFTVLVAISLTIFCLWWSQQWPPRNIWDEVEWCWSRQVFHPKRFGDYSWHCVRCYSEACAQEWLAFQNYPVSTLECNKMGWAYTEPSS